MLDQGPSLEKSLKLINKQKENRYLNVLCDIGARPGFLGALRLVGVPPLPDPLTMVAWLVMVGKC